MEEAPRQAVGFVGLGQMGAPMASRLAELHGNVIVYDTRREATAPLGEAGATVADSPMEVASRAGVVSVMVRDDDQVQEVIQGPVGILAGAREGCVIAIHSTISPAAAERMAEVAAPYGAQVVDAPVTGGFMGAREGTLAAMVGGTAEAFERCRGPFGAWGDLIVHTGPVGSGTRAKVARNLIHFVAFTGATEAQRLAEAAGIDLPTLARVVRHSDAVTGGASSIMLRSTTAPMTPEDNLYDILDHVRNLGDKDLSLARELGRELGVDVPLAELASERFAPGLGFADASTDRSLDADPDPDLTSDDRRRRGLAMMRRVYGWDVEDGPGDFFAATVDHLFADVWTRQGLGLRDRRLLLLGLLAGQGLDDVAEIQIGAALSNGELTPSELREIVLFLTHYAGWPLGAKLNATVEKLIARHERDTAGRDGADDST